MLMALRADSSNNSIKAALLAAGQPPVHPFSTPTPTPYRPLSLSHRICIPKSPSETPGEDCSSLIYGVKANAGAFPASDPSATPPPSVSPARSTLGFPLRRWGKCCERGRRRSREQLASSSRGRKVSRRESRG